MRLYSLLKDVKIIRTNISDFSAGVSGITDSSKKVSAGCVFVCVPGITHDGHDYIGRAVLCGASVIVCERMTDEIVKSGIPYVLTDSSRRALALMWSAWYGNPQKSMTTFAVTGTNGKTSTCAFLSAILKCSGIKTGVIGSISNTLGGEVLEGGCMTTPDPELLFRLLAQMRDAGAGAVVMEASSHALALDKLSGITFDYGIFTNLTPEHLDFHPTMEDYAKAKSRLFRSCKTGIINADDGYHFMVTRNATCNIKKYSLKERAVDYFGFNIEADENSQEYLISSKKEVFGIKTQIIGTFTIYNTLAAAACAYECGIPSPTIYDGISSLSAIKGRAERLPCKRGFSVYIDYAHTPDALEKIIFELKKITKGRLIVVFGCGGDRDRKKRPLMGAIAVGGADLTVITTDNPRSEDPDAIIADILSGVDGKGNMAVVRDRKKALEYALSSAKEGDTVLVAGKGHEDYQILKDGVHPFSEHEIIEKILNE